MMIAAPFFVFIVKEGSNAGTETHTALASPSVQHPLWQVLMTQQKSDCGSDRFGCNYYHILSMLTSTL